MKPFLASAIAVIVIVALSSVIFRAASVSSTERYSMRSALPDHSAPMDGSLGWFRGEAVPH